MSANTRILSEMTLELRPSEAIPNHPSFHAAYQMQNRELTVVTTKYKQHTNLHGGFFWKSGTLTSNC
jgi:hypothetical protein